jgi:proteic killer suppression protein
MPIRLRHIVLDGTTPEAMYTSSRYTDGAAMAIHSFGNEAVKEFFERGSTGPRLGWKNVSRVVARKLDMLDYAHELGDLRSPPGNRLEALRGRWRGFHSIRVNDQWRVVFRWSHLGPEEVDVVDYH